MSLSLLLGGVCYAVPTLCAAGLMHAAKPYPTLAGAALIGSFGIKTGLAIVLMIAVFWLYPKVYFLPFFIGLLATSHLIFLFFLKVYRYGK